jgi:exosortase
LKRQTIFSEKRSFSVTGLILVIVGIVLLSNICEFITSGDDNGFVSHLAFSMVLIWIGGFALCYGTGALRAAAFSLLFLFFMVPIPDFALDKFVSLLQNGSTLAAYGFFKLSGVPMVREGYVFHLPTINIIVARECSGIRSALSLVITGLVAGHLFLRTGWSKFILVLFIVPLAIIKNGFRIAVLSLLGVYVDERILGSELHRNGGILFFILSLVLLWGIIALLKKAEGRLQHENEPTLLAEKAHKP